MSRTRVTSIRLSEEDLNRLKSIAEKRGVDFTTLVREALSKYTEIHESSQLPADVEELLKEFRERVGDYVARVKQFCEEHAREITAHHESEKGKFEYWRDACLHRYRNITRHNLNVYVKDRLLPQVNTNKLDGNQLVELEKRISDIVNQAVNEIYASQYPPVYPL